MANFAIPATWDYDGGTSDRSVFRLDGHTTKANRLAIFDRKLSVNSNGEYTMPTYRVRFIRTFTDSVNTEIPLGKKAVYDINMRWPLEATPAGLKTMMDEIVTFFSDANIQTDIIDLQRIPKP